MNQYIIVYLGGDQPSSPEAGKKHFAQYQAWLQSLGSAAVVPMAPVKNNHTITPNGTVKAGSAIAMTGHTVVQAESIEAAIELAKDCPFLEINGTLEIAELIKMN